MRRRKGFGARLITYVGDANCKTKSFIDKNGGKVYDSALDWPDRDHLCKRSHDREDNESSKDESEQSADWASYSDDLSACLEKTNANSSGKRNAYEDQS